jgi:hypothetical protein
MQREQSPSWVGPLTALVIVLILIGLAILFAWTIGEDAGSSEHAALRLNTDGVAAARVQAGTV